MFSKLALAALLAVAQLADAMPGAYYKQNRRSSGVDVKLDQAGETEVKLTVTNTGSETLKLLKLGSVFDDAPVNKLRVSQDGKPVEYTGLLFNVDIENLPESGFITLEAGASKSTTINVAALFSLTGGAYTIQAADALPFATLSTNKLSGVIEFTSNALTTTISPESISRVAPAISKRAIENLSERTVVTSCSGSQGTALRNAIARSASQARAAASAASSGNAAKFQEYFRTTAAASRSLVSTRFSRVASESGSTTSGGTRYYCNDALGACQSGVIAYTSPSQNIIANCSPFYSLRAVSTGCGQQSQAATVLHEFTHANAVYTPICQDYAYGYAASTRLSSSQAVQNADNYALYADAILNGC